MQAGAQHGYHDDTTPLISHLYVGCKADSAYIIPNLLFDFPLVRGMQDGSGLAAEGLQL